MAEFSSRIFHLYSLLFPIFLSLFIQANMAFTFTKFINLLLLRSLYKVARAVLTKYHILGVSNNKHLFSYSFREIQEVQDQGVCRFGFFRGLCPWYRRSPSHCVLTWLSLWLCPNLLLEGHWSYWLGCTYMTSFNFNYLFKGLISVYSHVLRSWG